MPKRKIQRKGGETILGNDFEKGRRKKVLFPQRGGGGGLSRALFIKSLAGKLMDLTLWIVSM